jgi:superfamily II DNA/RNA helicase
VWRRKHPKGVIVHSDRGSQYCSADYQELIRTHGVGGNKQANEKLQERLNPATGSGHIIALCSDAMSEGVNLQRASAMLHLDMPSVVRYAEQRVGRIDRMDSPHDQIEC